MAKEFLHGSYSFETFAPGFVNFKLNPVGDIRYLLEELKLLVSSKKGRWRFHYDFEPDFKEFLAEHGYTSPIDILKAMKGDGLIMKSDRAIAFRLRFL